MKEIYSKTLADVTSKLPRPITCSPDSTVKNALDLMVENDIGSVIVVDKDDLPVGIITERDFLIRIIGKNIEIDTVMVSDVMTPNPQSLTFNKPVSSALVHMRIGKFRHISITDKSGKLIKVFSIKDALNFLNDEMSERMSQILTP